MNKLIINIISFLFKRSESLVEEKNKIRQEIRSLKKQISIKQKLQEADLVFQKIEELEEFKAAKTILFYWSTTNEMPTHDFVNKWSSKKLIVLPAVKRKKLILKQFFSSEAMEQGSLGIWEPDSLETYDGKVDLVIVPGVAFDLNKNRLGRGKGFYDRFFRKNNLLKIGVSFDFQLFDSIPSGKTDIPMDIVVTPSKLIK